MFTDYAARARALVGTRFRPQGRGEGGLDCIGVVLITFAIAPELVRRDYRLKGKHHFATLRTAVERHFRRVPRTQLRSGDVMLLAAGNEQPHLAIRTPGGFVHAHAGVGRVVETPGDPEWALLAVYRKRRRH
jgi:murein DD-endopeptidase / murein LD-carboxypeptidase